MEIMIIGAGNMGSALAKGIAKAGIVPPDRLMVTDIVLKKAKDLANTIGAKASDRMEDAVANSDVIILCVKPDIAESVTRQISPALRPGTVFCSIAVSIPIAKYRKHISKENSVFRIMPNTPALVGEGTSIVSFEEDTSPEDIAKVLKIFDCVGKTQVLDEGLMNSATALTGSSPAYIYTAIEAMGNAGIRSGIPADISYRLAAQTVLGTAKMVIETGLHPAVLKDQVCSPGGTTIEAVAALEKHGFRYAIMNAMEECVKKADEISEKINGK